MPNRNVTLSRKDFEQLSRVHVLKAVDWADAIGKDYWLSGNGFGVGPLSTSQGELLSEHGWTTTSLAQTAGSGADLMSSADQGVPASVLNDASADQLRSPNIFGDYQHAQMAAELLGHQALPRYIVADTRAIFTVNSANEATSGLGFVNAGGSAVVSANKAGAIESNGTNWVLDVSGTLLVSAIAVDVLPHNFRVVIDRLQLRVFGYVDGVTIGTAGIANVQDVYPVSWGAASGVTNRVQVSGVHVYYAWQTPNNGFFPSLPT